MASKSIPLLRHIHLTSPTSYHHASRLQDHLVRQFLSHKAAVSSSSSPTAVNSAQPPRPTILTFSPNPIYTTGRRELHTPLSEEQTALLTTPLQPSKNNASSPLTASITAAQRGGQITFHGPGQLVIYPILDLRTAQLRSRDKPGVTPRCYVNLLEGATVAALASYGIQGGRTADPGVWLVGEPDTQARDERGLRRQDYKIAALGVHLRRNVTSHGVGLNVSTDLRWFDRIVACGLEGKGVTSMLKEGVNLGSEGVEEVAGVWVKEFAKGLGIDERSVVKETESDILAEMGNAESND